MVAEGARQRGRLRQPAAGRIGRGREPVARRSCAERAAHTEIAEQLAQGWGPGRGGRLRWPAAGGHRGPSRLSGRRPVQQVQPGNQDCRHGDQPEQGQPSAHPPPPPGPACRRWRYSSRQGLDRAHRRHPGLLQLLGGARLGVGVRMVAEQLQQERRGGRALFGLFGHAAFDQLAQPTLQALKIGRLVPEPPSGPAHRSRADSSSLRRSRTT